jgi:outer membrane protein OmpU
MTETEGKIMKKILIATTALVATAGVAAADVTVSGWAYGIVYAGDAFVTGGGSEIQRGGRIQFSASTQTDGGLGLAYYSRMTSYNGDGTVPANLGTSSATGAAVTANPIISGENGLQWNRVSLSYEGMSLDLGNANGAGQSTARYTLGYIGVDDSGVGVGLGLADNRTATTHTDGGDNAVFKYTMGNVLIAASTTLDGTGVNEVGIRYTDNGLTVGYSANNNSEWRGLVTYTMGSVTASVGANSDDTTLGGVSYDMGNGLTVGALMASRAAGDSYGIDVSYDLGGGATLGGQFGETAGGDKGAAVGIFFTF